MLQVGDFSRLFSNEQLQRWMNVPGRMIDGGTMLNNVPVGMPVDLSNLQLPQATAEATTSTTPTQIDITQQAQTANTTPLNTGRALPPFLSGLMQGNAPSNNRARLMEGLMNNMASNPMRDVIMKRIGQIIGQR